MSLSRVKRYNVAVEVNAPNGGGGTVRGDGVTAANSTGAGVVVLTLTQGFALQEMCFNATTGAAGFASCERTSADTVTVRTFNASGTATDLRFTLTGTLLPPGDIATT